MTALGDLGRSFFKVRIDMTHPNAGSRDYCHLSANVSLDPRGREADCILVLSIAQQIDRNGKAPKQTGSLQETLNIE